MESIKHKEAITRADAQKIQQDAVDPLEDYLAGYRNFTENLYSGSIKLLKRLHSNKKKKVEMEEDLYNCIDEIRYV
jgi:hypothetical protein